MTGYLVANHVHCCETGGQLIFLDLRHDKYFSVGRDELTVLEKLLTDEGESRADAPDSTDGTSERLVDALSQAGLITSDKRCGRKYVPAELSPVASSTLLDDELAPVTLTHGRVIAFIYACIRASLALTCVALGIRSLERVVGMRQRRRQARKQASTNIAADKELVGQFHTMRPFLYTSKDRCLFDSIALLDFLAVFDSYPEWVIGVRTLPFGAHSWVQAHGCVFNCPIEQVRRFVPILVV